MKLDPILNFLNKNHEKIRLALCGIFFYLYFYVLWHTAWLSDDAVITLRASLNMINGYGPVFNIGERVQAYTHPLWFILITFVSYIAKVIFNAFAEVFVADYLVSYACSLATFYILLTRFTKSIIGLLFGITALFLSRSFIDYSTSGLENPLTHLLLVLFLYNTLKENGDHEGKSLFWGYIITALLYLNRPDSILLVIPTLLYLSYRYLFLSSGRDLLFRSIFYSALIVFIWVAFSVIYYGFPLPNTAYAKLLVNIPYWEKVKQGYNYILFMAWVDPLSIIIIAFAFGYSLFSSWFYRSYAFALFIYIFYVISIGGDFMVGRFYSGPVVLSVALLLSAPISYKKSLFLRPYRQVFALICCFALICIWGQEAYKVTWVYHNKYTNREYFNFGGIADERLFWTETNSLPIFFHGKGTYPKKGFKWEYTKIKDVYSTYGNLGFISVLGGADLFAIDTNALADPLLARLPRSGFWRIGHFDRRIPKGYKQTILTGENVIEDPEVKEYYDQLKIIVSGPIFTKQRFWTILKMNLGLIPPVRNIHYLSE